jgi:lycopene cyclase domain-containing protein
MPVYPLTALAAAGAVIALELFIWRTGLLRQRGYWISMSIILGFMLLVDGWLTKLSSPIVVYNPSDVSGWRPVWDILAEEYAYAFALITLVLLCWERSADAAAFEDAET